MLVAGKMPKDVVSRALMEAEGTESRQRVEKVRDVFKRMRPDHWRTIMGILRQCPAGVDRSKEPFEYQEREKTPGPAVLTVNVAEFMKS